MKGGFFKKGRLTKALNGEKSMSKITEYFKEIKGELKHVVWPTKNQTIFYTIIVVVLSVVIAYFLGIFDFIFSQGLQKIIAI